VTIEFRDNMDASRYELALDGVPLGFAYYQTKPGLVVFTHTEVLPEAEGKGVGSTLIRSALGDVRRRGLRAVPLCPFVASFLKRHPEYADVVDDNYRAAVQPS
jgi:predicted GNAT family acetyltransferase